jgi:hypothetical protein
MTLRIAGGRLGGWSRLGIVLTLLWTLIVALELSAEYHFGPFSLALLTDTVETGGPVASIGVEAIGNAVLQEYASGYVFDGLPAASDRHPADSLMPAESVAIEK